MFANKYLRQVPDTILAKLAHAYVKDNLRVTLHKNHKKYISIYYSKSRTFIGNSLSWMQMPAKYAYACYETICEAFEYNGDKFPGRHVGEKVVYI